MSGRLRVVVSGMLAGVPAQGGAAWAVLQYVLGLRRLGHDVTFVEPVAGVRPASARYLAALARRFGLEGRAGLLDTSTGATVGLDRASLRRAADGADLLLNLSGVLADEALLGRIGLRAFVDLDPGFTQLWCAAEGLDLGLDRHDRFVTIGTRIGSPGCPVPTCGRTWVTTLQPVVLEHWPVAGRARDGALSTVGHWRSYGSIEHDGVHYGQRAHTLRRFLALPDRSGARVTLALGIHPDERADLDALAGHGWGLVDPATVAGTPEAYARFVRGSWAELNLAKSGYAASACGWFSDRSICYLASGRPVIALDTGFAPAVPAGDGVLAVTGIDDAVAAVEDLRSRYAAHRAAARALAEDLFASDRVLQRLLACL